MDQEQLNKLELTDNQMLLLTKAVETEAAEERALAMGPEAHETFVDMRGEIQERCGDISWSDE